MDSKDLMDWMQFVSSLTASLAWPTGAVVLGYTMRHSVTDLLSRVKSLEAGGVKLSVAARAAEAVENIEPPQPYALIEQNAQGQIEADKTFEQLPQEDTDPADTLTEQPAAATGRPPASPMTDRAPIVVSNLPADGRAVIMANWARTQYRLRAALAASGNATEGPLTDQALFDRLESKNLISSETKKALLDLRTLKNDVYRGRIGANYVDGKAFESSTHLIIEEIVQYGGEKVAAALVKLDYLDSLAKDEVVERLKTDFPLRKFFQTTL